MRLAFALAVLAASVAASGAGAAVGRECAGIPTCISVPGPWVAVAESSESQFLLDCPQRRGIVGGVDVLAGSRDVHVSWDARLGSPVSPGRSTTRYTFFRAVSGHHKAGLFQPRIGCIPSGPANRATTSARAVAPAGEPLDLAAATIPLKPGSVHHGTLGCANKEKLVYSWDAVAFATTVPPPPELAAAIEVHRTVSGGKVLVKVQASEALPSSAKAVVQIGVACTR